MANVWTDTASVNPALMDPTVHKVPALCFAATMESMRKANASAILDGKVPNVQSTTTSA